MENKVSNNEVMVFGKLSRAYKKLKINNQGAIQLMLEVEDDNFPGTKNKVFAYAMTGDKTVFKNFIGNEVGIDGHIITHMGTKVIIDAIQMA